MGEKEKQAFQPTFNGFLKVDFQAHESPPTEG